MRPFTGVFAVAVPIFLLISGFLLYRPFAAARTRGRPMPSVLAYGWRRVLRIVPAYWVAVTLIGLWLGSRYLFYIGNPPADIFSGTGLLGYYGFTQIYSAETRFGGIAQAWTIDTEVAFYLALPLYCLLAYWLMRRYAMSWRGEVGLLCGVIALSWWRRPRISSRPAAAVPVGDAGVRGPLRARDAPGGAERRDRCA